VAEVDLVRVEREDLALRVSLLDLDRQDRFLHLALDRLVEADGKEIARELLRDRAGARQLALHHVVDQGDHDARHTEAEVLVEAAILGRDDRLPERRGDLVVAHHDAPFGRKLADDAAVAGEEARDRVGAVVVERADLREVVAEREQHSAQRAEQRGEQEERGDSRTLRQRRHDAAAARGRGRLDRFGFH
jgi:hypothetical protein